MADGLRSFLQKSVGAFYQMLEITVAILVLTGQLTVRSIVISPGSELRVTLSGAITGFERTIGRPEIPGAQAGVDFFDAIVALLLIIGQLNVSGLFISSERFSLTIGGPAFGTDRTVAYVPEAREFLEGYREALIRRYTTQKQGERM